MREPLKDRTRLEHIVESIDNIYNFTNDKSADDISKDKMLFYAVVKNIEIIGEAAYHLSQAFRNKHPETQWEDIMRMRNVLVHDYYQIKEKEVWQVIKDDLQPLREQTSRYISETNWDEWEKDGRVIAESASHKTLIQTARRMKGDGMNAKQISRYTGLSAEEIEQL
ncbi:MAG: DUF86 domain-containing protein [Bacteroidales bacterium]|nr:DUF86 domain-containing protein [Bacteroidales bacterium]